MAAIDNIPTRDEVRRILGAAADVVFSDGVHETFLEQWADETMFMLSLSDASRSAPTPHRSR